MPLHAKIESVSHKVDALHAWESEVSKPRPERELSPPLRLSHTLEFSPSASTAYLDEDCSDCSIASSDAGEFSPPGLSQRTGGSPAPEDVPPSSLSSPKEALPCLSALPQLPAHSTRRPPPGLARSVRDVWSWNFDEEWMAFLAVASSAGAGAAIAVDTKFLEPLSQDAGDGDQTTLYELLRDKLKALQAMQIGFAVAAQDGTIFGAWNFHLLCDPRLRSQPSISTQPSVFANFDIQQHATAGISIQVLGKKLQSSNFVGNSEHAPSWVTFSGFVVLGHLLSVISQVPFPQSLVAYNAALSKLLPTRVELRESMPWCSFDGLLSIHQLERSSTAKTAGNDALAILDLHLRVVASAPRDAIVAASENSERRVAPPTQREDWAAFARSVRVKASAPWRRAQVPDVQGEKSLSQHSAKSRDAVPKARQHLPAGSVWAASAAA